MTDEAAPAPDAGTVTDVPVESGGTHIPNPTERQSFAQDEPKPGENPENAEAEGETDKKDEKPEKKDRKPSKTVDESLKKALKKSREESKRKADAEKKAEEAEEGQEPPTKGEETPKDAKPAEGNGGEEGADAQKQAEAQPKEGQDGAQDAQQTPEGQQQGQQGQEGASDHDTPPSRFHEAAKSEWANAPESVRAETNRAVREMQEGIEKYRGAAERYSSTFQQFDALAQQNGVDAGAQLQEYVGIAQLLQKDFTQGLDVICRNAGTSLNQVVQQLAGQSPDQAQQRSDQTINELRQQVTRLEQQLGGVNSTLENQQRAAVREQISAFADKNPRFEELSGTIEKLLRGKVASDLNEAYEMADRLNPAPSQAPAPTPAPDQTRQQSTQPLNPAGQKSISGAPASGEVEKAKPGRKKGPAPSIDEALEKAMRRAS